MRDRYFLWVRCKACEHRARVDPAKIAARIGYDVPVPGLSGKLKCSKCGRRGADVTVGNESGEDGRR